MVTLTQIVEELSSVLDRPAAEKIAQVILSVRDSLHENLVVKRLEALENAVKQLTEQVSRSEEQFRQMRVEFEEYRKQTDERFRELAEAQRRTDQQIARLEQQVARLVEAQLRTQEEIRDIRRQLGGLSQTVGYTLENEAMKRLPELLHEVGIRVEGRLTRRHVQDGQGNYLEVNIFGTGYRNGEPVTLVGESKAQLSKNDVDRFLRRTVNALQGVYPNIVPLLITHITSEPDAEDYARAQGVLVYYSYEL